MPQQVLFDNMMGRWEGNCRTWFEPGTLADESTVTGEITGVLDGRFLRHTDEGMIQGKPRRGEDMIACNSIGRRRTWSLLRSLWLFLSEGGVEVNRGTDERLECARVHFLLLMDVDRASGVPVKARIEELARVP